MVGVEAEQLRREVGAACRAIGLPLLPGVATASEVMTARPDIVAMDTSVSLGRLVVLDTFEDDEDVLSPEALRGETAAAVVLAETRSELERVRDALLRTDPANEAAWSRLEDAANLYLELERGVATGHGIRVDRSPVPARETTRNW